MVRKLITIDENLCDGCGLCVSACAEGALGIVDGKAKLLSDDYCDGLGACLPACPKDAIHFEEREAVSFDAKAAEANMERRRNEKGHGGEAQTDNGGVLACGCPSAHAKRIGRTENVSEYTDRTQQIYRPQHIERPRTHLNPWPVQIKLAPPTAPYFNNAHLLVAADCAAYAYGDFHERFMKNKITVIGCPKLDEEDYAEKLTSILKSNSIKSVTIVRMEVPCCGGIVHMAKTALKNCGKMIPWQIATLTTDGEIIDE